MIFRAPLCRFALPRRHIFVLQYWWARRFTMGYVLLDLSYCFKKIDNVPVTVCVISGFRVEVDENCSLLGYSITQRVVVNSYRRFGTNCPSHRPRIVDSWNLKMGPICCPEPTIRNYCYSLSNNAEERCTLTWNVYCGRVQAKVLPLRLS